MNHPVIPGMAAEGEAFTLPPPKLRQQSLRIEASFFFGEWPRSQIGETPQVIHLVVALEVRING